MTTKSVLAILVSLLASSAVAFQTAYPVSHPSSSTLLRTATTADSVESVDTFDAYDTTNPGQDLAIKEIKIGDGPELQKDDLITVRHIGTVMESGKSLGEHTFQFQHLESGRVMPGWSQGMEGMRIGGRRVLRIPPRLGYGNRAVGGSIPANSHLEFDVEVLQKDESPWALFLYKTGFKADLRTAGIFVCLGYLALSPLIEKKLNGM